MSWLAYALIVVVVLGAFLCLVFGLAAAEPSVSRHRASATRPTWSIWSTESRTQPAGVVTAAPERPALMRSPWGTPAELDVWAAGVT